MTPQEADRAVCDDFVCQLVVAHRSGSPELASMRRWHPRDVDADFVALAAAAPSGEYPCFALTAKLFAVWHQGRSAASEGYATQGIGRWVHQLGVRDPKAKRLISRIIAADTEDELNHALTALAAMRTRRSPHWATVLTELLRWADPATRADIRFDWARDFYRYEPPGAGVSTRLESPSTQETT
jgi:hypothetical protein